MAARRGDAIVALVAICAALATLPDARVHGFKANDFKKCETPSFCQRLRDRIREAIATKGATSRSPACWNDPSTIHDAICIELMQKIRFCPRPSVRPQKIRRPAARQSLCT